MTSRFYPFPYLVLDDREHQIRLLTLHPGPLDAPIICSLSYMSLQLQLPPYETLSCTTGQGSANWKIVVDGHDFGVKEHIAAALRALRYEGKSRTIWAEAVCVNALDIAERSLQLQLKNEIFGRAEGVIVWLGPGTVKTDETFRVIERHIESINSPGVGEVNWDDAYGYSVIANLSEEVLSQKWWSWAPAVQDVALSSNVTVMCGSLTIPWTTFVGLLEWLRARRVESGRLLKNTFLDSTNVIKTIYSLRTRQELCQLLLRICPYDSSDFRERVSAAFGVREKIPDQLPSIASYTRAVPDVQRDVVDACLRFDQSLDILSMAGLADSTGGKSSWLPELEQDQPAWKPRNILTESSYSHLVQPTLSRSSSLFAASAKNLPRTNITTSAGKPLLAVAGVPIDQIEIVPTSSLGRSTPSLLKTWEIVLSYAFGTMEAFQSLTDRWVARMTPRILNPEAKKSHFVSCLVDGNVEQCELRRELFRKSRDLLLKNIPNYNLRRTRPHYLTPAAFQNAYFRTILTDRTASRERTTAAYLRACMTNLESGNQSSLVLLHEVLPNVPQQDRRSVLEGDFLAAVEASLQFRTLFVTKTGYIGLGPLTMKPNDIICVLLGYSVPVVLRRQGPSSYALIGECYVHGIMDGEALGQDWEENLRTFNIF